MEVNHVTAPRAWLSLLATRKCAPQMPVIVSSVVGTSGSHVLHPVEGVTSIAPGLSWWRRLGMALLVKEACRSFGLVELPRVSKRRQSHVIGVVGVTGVPVPGFAMATKKEAAQ